jgi:hypothetical protein
MPILNGLMVKGRSKYVPVYWSGNQWVGETDEDQGKDGLRTLKKIYR